MLATIPFHRIFVNVRLGEREIIFQYGKKWFKMKWSDVPEKFKVLYAAKLKLERGNIPDDLKPYERSEISVGDINIELNLDKAEEVKENAYYL